MRRCLALSRYECWLYIAFESLYPSPRLDDKTITETDFRRQCWRALNYEGVAPLVAECEFKLRTATGGLSVRPVWLRRSARHIIAGGSAGISPQIVHRPSLRTRAEGTRASLREGCGYALRHGPHTTAVAKHAHSPSRIIRR